MSRFRFVPKIDHRIGVLPIAFSLTLSACSDDTGAPVNGAGGNTGASSSGGAATGGQSSGGQSSSGGAMPQTGGTSSGGTSSGGAGTGGGGASSGGSDSGGTAGSGGEGTGGDGTGGATSTECTRELLDGLLDDYFAALSAGDPSTLPLAENVKFTENAQESEVGMTDFWGDAGDVKYSQRALDVPQCSVAAQAVVPEGGMDLPIAVRIKVDAGEMTEIETIVVRAQDYTASYRVDSNPGEIIALSDGIGWHDPVPEGDRASRDELISWMDNYFRSFPNGVCNVTPQCQRRENGGGDFACSTGAGNCSMTTTGGTMQARLIVADEERGIAAGLTIFDFGGADGHLDMHMMKMSGGQVHAVQAILRDTDGQSGWD